MDRLRSPLSRLAAFAAVVALLAAAAALAGAAIDPDRGASDANANANGHGASDGDDAHAGGAAGEHPVRGLAVAEDGLRLVVADPELERATAERLAFRIVDEHGETVRDFDVAHERRMHLIVARRDLTGFQHLHPRQGADGTWTTEVTLAEAGAYRVFADFTRDGEPHTLGADLRVDGDADLLPLPAPTTTAKSDGGLDVRLDREGDELRFTITRDGEPVATEPYLGAGGHLVALREGDLAFLHVHPTGEGVTFEASFPSPGRYRLFLQFKHEGRIHTVAFTEVVR
jgi:hypothetical protein